MEEPAQKSGEINSGPITAFPLKRGLITNKKTQGVMYIQFYLLFHIWLNSLLDWFFLDGLKFFAVSPKVILGRPLDSEDVQLHNNSLKGKPVISSQQLLFTSFLFFFRAPSWVWPCTGFMGSCEGGRQEAVLNWARTIQCYKRILRT